jgi:YD repeat-containing protein
MRTYGAKNELLTETAFAVPDPDGTGAGQPASPLTTRYAYNAANHLRFAVSAEGRVTEYRYNGFGQQIAAIQYTDTGNPYTLTGLDSGDVLTEAQLSTWVGSADKAKSLRSDSTYDFRGQVESTTNYAAVDAAGNGVVNGFESVMQYVYDQAGNLLWTVDPRGVELAERDTDWALAERLRLGYTVTDAVGVRAKRAAELSATDRTGLRALYTTTYLYDGLGRLRSATDATGRTTLTPLPPVIVSAARWRSRQPFSSRCLGMGSIRCRCLARMKASRGGAEATEPLPRPIPEEILRRPSTPMCSTGNISTRTRPRSTPVSPTAKLSASE